jgi:hypothetical protein
MNFDDSNHSAQSENGILGIVDSSIPRPLPSEPFDQFPDNALYKSECIFQARLHGNVPSDYFLLCKHHALQFWTDLNLPLLVVDPFECVRAKAHLHDNVLSPLFCQRCEFAGGAMSKNGVNAMLAQELKSRELKMEHRKIEHVKLSALLDDACSGLFRDFEQDSLYESCGHVFCSDHVPHTFRGLNWRKVCPLAKPTADAPFCFGCESLSASGSIAGGMCRATRAIMQERVRLTVRNGFQPPAEPEDDFPGLSSLLSFDISPAAFGNLTVQQ